MTGSDRLYELLPAVFRTRDAEIGEPLRAFAAILSDELDRLEADAETTWDNWFIETCEEWLVPYIGDALGVRGLRDITATDFSTRAYTADALERRRRRGTIAATEDAARAVTGYPARAVEMFQLTATTVNLNHLRGADAPSTTLGTVDLRDTERALQLSGPFDPFVRAPDVRPMTDNTVRPNLPNVELFLWRVRSEEISGSTARVDGTDPRWFRFDPLGRDLAVFNLPESEDSIRSLAGPEHLPRPIGRLELAGYTPTDDWPIAVTTITGSGDAAVVVEIDLDVCNLDDVGGALPNRQPDASGIAMVDPELGRIALHPDDVPGGGTDFEVIVDYVYGWPGRVGAGPYDRNELFAEQRRAGAGAAGVGQAITRQWGVSRSETALGDEDIFETIEEAVVAWNDFIAAEPAEERAGTLGVIAILDSRSYEAPGTQIELPDGSALALVGANWPERQVDGVTSRVVGDLDADGVRPHVSGTIRARGAGSSGASSQGGLLLNGLLIEGAIRTNAGDLERLDLAACTIEGPPVSIHLGSSAAATNGGLSVVVARTAMQRIRSTRPIESLEVVDSCLIGSATIELAGAAVSVNSSTVRGSIECRTLDGSDSIFDAGAEPAVGLFEIAQTQQGCLRFCYVPPGPPTPRRYRCQPDIALEGITDNAERERIIARIQPAYATSTIDPGFGLLQRDGPPELQSASADGSEPGVWHHLQHAQRMTNLRQALREELRFGLDAGVVFDR